MIRVALVVIPLIAFLGCKTESQAFCEAHPGVDHCPGDATNGGACSGDGDCTKAGFLACDTAVNGGTCVQCTATNHKACTDATPRCENDSCVACADDSDCAPNGVCLPSGACAASNSIIHAISSGGSEMATCGGTGAGNACTLDTALGKVTQGRNVVKLDDPGPYVSKMNNFVVDADTTIDLIVDARGATLHHNGNGAIFTVNNNRGFTIVGGTIEGAQGGMGHGIQCGMNATLNVYDTTITMNDQSAIAASSCTVSVTHATIASNSKAAAGLFPGLDISGGSITIARSQLISNRGGGITVGSNGKFTIVGNMFLSNGDDTLGTVGGLAVMTSLPGNRLEFNTFAGNKSTATQAAGIQCAAPANPMAAAQAQPGLAAPAFLTVQNNVVWNNNGSSGIQVTGTCLHAYSDIEQGALTGLDGGNNINQDPMFVGATDLDVNAASPIRGKANPKADLGGIAAKDIKGNLRALRAGAGADLGAYVVPGQ